MVSSLSHLWSFRAVGFLRLTGVAHTTHLVGTISPTKNRFNTCFWNQIITQWTIGIGTQCGIHQRGHFPVSQILKVQSCKYISIESTSCKARRDKRHFCDKNYCILGTFSWEKMHSFGHCELISLSMLRILSQSPSHCCAWWSVSKQLVSQDVSGSPWLTLAQ